MWESNDQTRRLIRAEATQNHEESCSSPRLQFGLSGGCDTHLNLQRMQDELLKALDGVLQIADCQGLVVAVRD